MTSHRDLYLDVSCSQEICQGESCLILAMILLSMYKLLKEERKGVVIDGLRVESSVKTNELTGIQQ